MKICTHPHIQNTDFFRFILNCVTIIVTNYEQGLFSMNDIVETKKPKGWQKGVSGNPNGRPAKSKIRKMWNEQGDAILEKVFAQALDGDVTSQKLILDRCVAPMKPKAEAVALGVDIDPNATAYDLAKLVVLLTAQGDLGTDQAQNLINALSLTAKIKEATELEQRIEALEKLR